MKSEAKLLFVCTIVIALLGWFAISHGAPYLHLILTIGGGIALTLFGDSNQTIPLAAGSFILIAIGALFAGFTAGILPGGAALIAGILSAIGTATIKEM